MQSIAIFLVFQSVDSTHSRRIGRNSLEYGSNSVSTERMRLIRHSRI